MSEGMTAEQWSLDAEKQCRKMPSEPWTQHMACHRHTSEAIRAAMAQARLAALEEAARLVENMNYSLDEGPGFTLDRAAEYIRALVKPEGHNP